MYLGYILFSCFVGETPYIISVKKNKRPLRSFIFTVNHYLRELILSRFKYDFFKR